MKIAFAYDTVYPETKGGVEKRVWELARRLAARGHEVHLLVPHAWDGPPSIERDGVILRGVSPRRNLYTRNGRRAVLPALVHALGVYRLLRREHFDLVDSQIPAHLAALASRAAARDRASVIQVITWHEVWEKSWIIEMGFVLGHIGRVVERLVTRIAAIHTVVSGQNRESLARLGREAEAVIPPGVESAGAYYLEVPESDILFVGRLVPTKNVGLLIEATATLAARGLSRRVLIVGDGPTRGVWEQQARDLGLTDLVTFTDPIDDEGRLMATLSSARVLALPSIREGFGMIALEAAALGVPVVTVDHPRNAARHVVQDGVTGLCVAPSPALFADAIESILSDEKLRLRLSRGALESARDETWDRAVDRTEAVYQVDVPVPLPQVVEAPIPGDSRREVPALAPRASHQPAGDGTGSRVRRMRANSMGSDLRNGYTAPWPDVRGLKFLGYCDYFRLPMIGGSERAALEVYKGMRERGADISVLTSTAGGVSQWSDVAGLPTWSHPMIDLTDVIKLQVGLSPGLLRQSLAMVTELAPRLLHASSIHFQSARVAASTARRTGLPLVTTAQVGSIEHLPLVPRLAAEAYERSVGARILATSVKVIAVSQSVAVHVIELGVSPEKVVVVPNGVDTSRFQPTDARRSKQIAFVGRLISNKGPEDALDAFALLNRRDWHLVFVGDGPLRQRLELKASELGVSGMVQFLGPRDDIPVILSKSAIAVRPSLTEGRSLAIMEAMAAGVCVVASGIAANRELIQDGVTGVLTPVGDPLRLAEALRWLVDNAAQRVSMGMAARDAILKSTWDATASKTAEVLLEVANEGDRTQVESHES